MRTWFYLFILSIGSGGFFALLVALARTPGIADFLPPKLFYHWLIGHVDLALIFGLLSFLIFLWHRILSKEGKPHEVLLSYAGALLIFLSALLGLGKPVHNNYIPTIVHPIFFTGVSLFFLGLFLTSLRFLKVALRNLLSEDSVKGFLSVSIVLSSFLPIALFISYLKTPHLEEIYLYFERLYWLPGHIHQFINATLLLSSWTLIAKLSSGKSPRSFGLINLWLLVFPLIYFVLQILVDNSISEGIKRVTTLGYAVGIGFPTLLYAGYLLLRFSFRKDFLSNALGLSVLIYILGALMGYLIAGSDLRIPAHYHGVIASILISLMVLTYHFLREMGFIKELPKAVKIQPYLYGIGMFLFVLGLFWAGVYGAPRKTYGTGYIENFKVYLFMLLMGLGSVLSVLGGIIFVGYILYSTIGSHGSSGEKEAQQEG